MNRFSKSVILMVYFLSLISISGCDQAEEAKKDNELDEKDKTNRKGDNT